jgi:hypothetical protein
MIYQPIEPDMRVLYPFSGSYRDSPTEVSIVNAARTMILGCAVRSGVTPPYMPDRPVYKIPAPAWWNGGRRWLFNADKYYVLEGNELIPHEHWLIYTLVGTMISVAMQDQEPGG